MLDYNLHTFLIAISFGLGCSIVGIAYTHNMTAPGEILDWWKDLLHKILLRKSIFHPRKEAPQWQHKLFAVMVGCPVCFSGQLCLWIYLPIPGYNFFEHFFSICSAIVFAKILNTLYIKLNQWEING